MLWCISVTCNLTLIHLSSLVFIFKINVRFSTNEIMYSTSVIPKATKSWLVFVSHLIGEWHEFSVPITEQSKAKLI